MDPERYHQIRYGCAIDSRFRLHLPDGTVLTPFLPLPNSHALHIAWIGNNSLNPRSLLLVGKDLHPIKVTLPYTEEEMTLDTPGKSGILLIGESHTRDILKRVMEDERIGQYDRHDHLFVSTVMCIEEAGWSAHWAPIQESGRLFHVRLIAHTTIRTGQAPTNEDTLKLAAAFTKKC